jgi:tetratricopeptide (TPR) repeat protein
MRKERSHPSKSRSVSRILVLALLASSLSLFANAQEKGEAPQPSFTDSLALILGRAETALAQQEVQLAESHYYFALHECWMQLGTLEVADSALPAAREAFEQATRATAGSRRVARVALALIQLHVDETDAAVSSLRVLVSEKPRDLQTRMHLVHALMLAGQIEFAQQELEGLRSAIPEPVARLEQALAESEGDEEARRELFLPRLNVGRMVELSGSDLRELRLRLRATQGQIYRNLSVLHGRADRPLRAAAHLKLADEVAPPRLAGSTEPVALGSVDLRVTPPTAVVKPLSTDDEFLWKTASIKIFPPLRLIQAGELSEAEAALRQILKEGDHPEARDMLAILLTEQKRYDEAEELLVAAIYAKTKNEIHMRQHLARLYLMREREVAATSQLRTAAKLGALDRDLAQKLVAIELAAGEKEAAKNLLRKLISTERSVQALLQLAEMSSTKDGPESVQALLHQAQGLAPNSEEVLALSGRSWLAVHRPEQAMRAFASLARMYPTMTEYAELLSQARKQMEASPETSE